MSQLDDAIRKFQWYCRDRLETIGLELASPRCLGAIRADLEAEELTLQRYLADAQALQRRLAQERLFLECGKVRH